MKINKSKSWRDLVQVHPAADIFPMMGDDELRELGENIKANGLTSPVVFTPDKQLIDGRNRLEACERVGLKIVRSAFQWINIVGLPGSNPISTVTDINPYDYVISANLHRRHLTGEQKRELLAKVLKAMPDKSNREIAKLAKVDDKTVAAVRRKLEATAELPQLPKTVGKDGKARPAKKPKSPKQPKPIDLEESTAPTGPTQDSAIEDEFEPLGPRAVKRRGPRMKPENWVKEFGRCNAIIAQAAENSTRAEVPPFLPVEQYDEAVAEVDEAIGKLRDYRRRIREKRERRAADGIDPSEIPDFLKRKPLEAAAGAAAGQ